MKIIRYILASLELCDYPDDFELTNRSIIQFALSWIVVIVLVFGLYGWIAGWLKTATGVGSSENVTEQWRFAYDYWEDLEALAQQVCNMERARELATTDNERSQRLTQQLAYENQYETTRSDFEARLRNAFEAKLVKPPDVPGKAPSLIEMKETVCSK